VGAVVLLVLYRRRARLGAVWGIIGCGVALLGSVAGVLAPRLAGVGALLGGEAMDRLEWISFLRFVLLALACVLLVIGALVGRGDPASSGSPRRIPGVVIALMVSGVVVMVLGAATAFVDVDLGAEHEGLTMVARLVVETVRFALLGLGVLILGLAVVSGRERADGHEEPGAVLGRLASQGYRRYRQISSRRW
jgi:hypothetical protein